MQIEKTKHYSWKTGNLPKGCLLCVKGQKLVLFITGFCPRRCFYCPVSEHKFGNDVVYANEWNIEDLKNPQEMLEEARLTSAKGAGITGGDPLTKLDRCVTYITLLKNTFGKSFHIHLYTSLRLVTEEKLQRLYDAGLDEIRFHLDIFDDSEWEKLSLARKFDWDVGVEIPVLHEYKFKTLALIDFIADKVDFLNLNELEKSDTQSLHYKLDDLGYDTKDDLSYGVKGSEPLALELLEYAKTKHLAAHYCTSTLKNKVQMSERYKLRAFNVSLPTDKITSEGLLIRGCIYVPELVPGLTYAEQLKNLDSFKILEHLQEAQQQLISKGLFPFLDEKKYRLLLSFKDIKKHKRDIKKLGFIPAIVEEDPTVDAVELEIDFL